MKLTAKEVYDKLLNEDKILTQQGRITFQFSDVSIIVKQRDVVGNIIQEWLEGWLSQRSIEYATNANTQMPPDIFLDPADMKHNLMEVKAFNHAAGPAFDIADFRMYEREVKEKPWMLDVDYIIFGYDMSPDGVVTVKNLWLKKVWEISRPMVSGKGNSKAVWPLNLQIKQGVVHKIRPAKWYSESKTFKTFECVEDFISAVDETVYKNKDTRDDGPGWLEGTLRSYEAFYDKKLRVPRWYEIEGKYIIEKPKTKPQKKPRTKPKTKPKKNKT